MPDLFFAEALKDVRRADEAFKEGDHPEAVFHAQQPVEKAVKAMIEDEREYVMNHGPALASQFSRLFVEELGEDLDTRGGIPRMVHGVLHTL
ncbi:HEPN domain-containing protein [Candidatus Bathyarchaeota archaeon]|nr:HEPN domain-containing protein [Candidatus Bathyarchaeota archaeon]